MESIFQFPMQKDVKRKPLRDFAVHVAVMRFGMGMMVSSQLEGKTRKNI
jgi:hypothetical protein